MALLSALFASFRKVNDKQLTKTIHHLHLAWMMKAAALPVLAILSIPSGAIIMTDGLGSTYWIALVVGALITTPLDTFTYLQSMKHGQLSKTAPLHSLWPVTSILGAVIFFGEIPSTGAIVAILAMVAGVFILNTSKDNSRLMHNLWNDVGTRFTMFGILTTTVNSLVGAVAIRESSALFAVFWSAVVGSIVQLVYAQILAPNRFDITNYRKIGFNGTLQGISIALYSTAVATGPFAYVAAVRSSAGTITALLGMHRLQEGFTSRKLAALGFIALGAVLLAISG